MQPQVFIQHFETYESCSIPKGNFSYKSSVRVSIGNALQLIAADVFLALRKINYIMVITTILDGNALIIKTF